MAVSYLIVKCSAISQIRIKISFPFPAISKPRLEKKKQKKKNKSKLKKKEKEKEHQEQFFDFLLKYLNKSVAMFPIKTTHEQMPHDYFWF